MKYALTIFIIFKLLTVSAQNDTSDFELLKGKIQIPVANYQILNPNYTSFGCQIGRNDNTLKIRCDSNAKVNSVANGKVEALVNYRDREWLLIIQHGNYYSCYRNLIDPELKENEHVTVGQIIGQTAGNYLEFELWKNVSGKPEQLNPLDWVELKN